MFMYIGNMFIVHSNHLIQNGSILLRGTDESISKSKDALNLIGKNAHLSNLNDKVISLISKWYRYC